MKKDNYKSCLAHNQEIADSTSAPATNLKVGENMKCKYFDCGWCYHADSETGECIGTKDCSRKEEA